MRIHEILETCVEYVAYDGVVGSDPAKLIQHLTKLDASLDYDYFAHIWTLLVAHPSIQVVLATYPLHSPGGTTYDGTAFLPDDYVPPETVETDVNLDTLYKEGVKGRQLVYMLAGEEFRTDRQAIADKRDAQEKARKRSIAKRKRIERGEESEADDEIKTEENSGLLRVVTTDDGVTDGHGEPIAASDLRRLWARWGARLRLRSLDDEIYYRLTGSHQKIPKITSTVFHILQLAAMSRDKGITVVELGPHVGASQGSMHYYMKVLLQMGLCAKVPAVIHGAITNLLIFHKFLHENPSYRASIGLDPTATHAGPSEPQLPVDAPNAFNEDGKGDDEEEENEAGDPSVDDEIPITEWGLNFPPLVEAELASFHIVRQRVLKILDHPLLKNHLLRTQRLLIPLGWQGEYRFRHARALRRTIDKLVESGEVERVAVGENQTICIRLTKYNTDAVAAQPVPATLNEVEPPSTPELDLEVVASLPPFAVPGGVPISLTFEYIISELVAQSGLDGVILKTLWRDTGFMFKRALDFAILRADNAHIPAHLWPLSMSSVMETYGKERRLRFYSTGAYREIMISAGQMPTGYPALPPPEEAGVWSDQSHKRFFKTLDQITSTLSSSKLYQLPPPTAAAKDFGKVGGAAAAKKAKPTKRAAENDAAGLEDDEGQEEKQKSAHMIGPQIRGRPRKYVHVVEPDGKINRRIIGIIHPRPDIPPVLVYLPDRNLIVEAPVGYSGVGAPPPASEEAIKAGHPPHFYYQFPTKEAAMGSAQYVRDTAPTTNARKGKKEKGKESEKDSKKDKAKKGKAKEAEEEGDLLPARKSKRAKKEVTYKEPKEADIDDIIEEQAVDEQGTAMAIVDDAAIEAEQLNEPEVIIAPAGNEEAPPSQPPADAEVNIVVEAPAPTPAPKKRGRPKKVVEGSTDGTPGQTKGPHAQKKETTDPVPVNATDTAEAPPTQELIDPSVLQSALSEIPPGVEVLTSATVPGTEPATASAAVHVPVEAGTTLGAETGLPVDPPIPYKPTAATSTPTPTTAPRPRGRKRKSVPAESPSSTPAPATSAKKKRGKVDFALNDSTPGPSSADRPIFDLSSALLEESPFELPADIMAASPLSRSFDPTVNVFEAAEPITAERLKQEHNGQGETPGVAEEFSKGDGPLDELPAIIEPTTPMNQKRSQRQKKTPHTLNSVGNETEAVAQLEGRHIPQSEADIRQPSALSVDASPPPPVPTPTLVSPRMTRPVSPVTQPAEPDVFVQALLPPSPASRAESMMPPPTPSQHPSNTVEEVTPSQHQLSMSTPAVRERSASQTPLRDIGDRGSETPSTPRDALLRLANPAYSGTRPRVARVDIGMLRRTEELLQALIDCGGISTDSRIGPEHRLWAERVAGTDQPHAPKEPFTMDKSTVRKVTRTLLNEGRLKETSVSSPTTTGRWTKTTVLYIPTVSQPDLQAYIRKISSTIAQTSAQIPRISATLADLPYTQYRPSLMKPTKVVTIASRADGESGSLPNTSDEISDKRLALLQEINVVAQLYGWKSGRCVRAHTLHRAIVEVFTTTPDLNSIMSNSPRIFAMPLLFEEISVDAYFSCILTLQYDEDLDKWLQDPENRKLRVKDIPKHLGPPGGFGGHTVKRKMATLLQILTLLRVITPLTPCEREKAEVFSERAAEGQENGYKISKDEVFATYYLVNNVAPVYHLAIEPPSLLGVAPIRSLEQIGRYWSALKVASFEADPAKQAVLETVDEAQAPADFPETLELTTDQTKTFQHRGKWRDVLHILPSQKQALEATIDSKGNRLVTSRDEVEKLAYENALPPGRLELELNRMSEAVREKASARALRIQEGLAKAQEKQEKIQESLRVKMLERQKADLDVLEIRVRLSAERQNFSYDAEMLDFVRRQTVMTIRRLDPSEAQLDSWVRVWYQTRNMSKEEREAMLASRKEQQKERSRARMPSTKLQKSRVMSVKKVADKSAGGTTQQRRTRSKRKWTNEDEDLLLDAEAIIRARSRSTKYIGRAAMSQLYPSMSAQTFAARIKKAKAKPGKEVYLKKLEEAWYDLWLLHRGTDELPDEHLDDPSEFPLREHIDFLRSRVDKRSLRMAAASTPANDKRAPNLPLDLTKLLQEHKWTYDKPNEYTYDYFGDPLTAEEIRVANQATLSLLDDVKPSLSISGLPTRSQGMLDATLKMVVATPTATYEPKVGEKVLESWDSKALDDTIGDMVHSGILRKVAATSATAGRSYDFTGQWHLNSEGQLPQELVDDAEGLSVKLDKADGGMEWPLIGKAGELAALMNMVSNHEIDISFDLEEVPSLKYEKGHYNTRKLNDDTYEFELHVKRTAAPQIRADPPSLSPLTSIKAPTLWDLPLPPEQEVQTRDLAERVFAAVSAAGSLGLTKPTLLSSLGLPTSSLNAALALLACETPSRVFWAGYDTPHLVSLEHKTQWTVQTLTKQQVRDVKDNPQGTAAMAPGEIVRLTPRKWGDVFGGIMVDEWKRAVNAVLTTVLMRPGTSERALREKLSSILNRMETNDILQHLLQKGDLTRRWISNGGNDGTEEVLPPVEAVDIDEEVRVAWWPCQETLWL